MERLLSSFPLPPLQLQALFTAGFTTAHEILELKPTDLSKELNITKEDALSIIQCVSQFNGLHSSKLKSQTAWEMLNDEAALSNIITFSEQIDNMIGGGIPVSKITEVSGAPGIGKTQLCMQLAVDVQIPEAFGGLGGEAIYIDTEGSFIIQRFEDIAMAAIEHCKEVVQSGLSNGEDALKSFTLDHILSSVYIYRCHDYIQLIATIHLLSEFIETHPNVKLIIIDSIAFHFRHDFDDYALRTKLLNGIAQILINIAVKNKLAVLLTNQLTTKFYDGGSSQLIPALGESWGHAPTLRIILQWQNKQRWAYLFKSPSHKEARVPYQITTGGIRDICSNEGTSETNLSQRETDENINSKKRKISTS